MQSEDIYYQKYLKYKQKYTQLKGGMDLLKKVTGAAKEVAAKGYDALLKPSIDKARAARDEFEAKCDTDEEKESLRCKAFHTAGKAVAGIKGTAAKLGATVAPTLVKATEKFLIFKNYAALTVHASKLETQNEIIKTNAAKINKRYGEINKEARTTAQNKGRKLTDEELTKILYADKEYSDALTQYADAEKKKNEIMEEIRTLAVQIQEIDLKHAGDKIIELEENIRKSQEEIKILNEKQAEIKKILRSIM